MTQVYLERIFYYRVFQLDSIKMIIRSFFFLIILCAVTAVPVGAQIVVTQNASAQQLAQMLSGTGVTISNYTLTGDGRASGTFTDSSNTGLGISQNSFINWPGGEHPASGQ